MIERRGAPRHPVPPDVAAEIGGIPARLLELSLVGAKIEHHDRFSLTSPRLNMTWRGNAASVAVRAARTEVVRRHVYNTGLYFVDIDSIARGFISSILNAEIEPAPLQPHQSEEDPEIPGPDDTWMRRLHVLKEKLDEDFPYAQFRLTEGGWRKEYVASTAQPEDGFTIPRDRYDFEELKRAFETADADTRRMMQIALEAGLNRRT